MPLKLIYTCFNFNARKQDTGVLYDNLLILVVVFWVHVQMERIILFVTLNFLKKIIPISPLVLRKNKNIFTLIDNKRNENLNNNLCFLSNFKVCKT